MRNLKGQFIKGGVSLNKGKKASLETREKQSEVRLKNPNRFWFGKKRSPETIEKMREAKIGKRASEETKAKMRGRTPWNKGKPFLEIKGEKNYRWKGGITSINRKIRTSLEYKLWRKSVFERDKYMCIWCGLISKKGIKVFLHADHIKPFALFPELRFAIDNGRTLCKDCHKKTDTWGNKSRIN